MPNASGPVIDNDAADELEEVRADGTKQVAAQAQAQP
jgi:hypothetical protein